jgi:hypothetical protein
VPPKKVSNQMGLIGRQKRCSPETKRAGLLGRQPLRISGDVCRARSASSSGMPDMSQPARPAGIDSDFGLHGACRAHRRARAPSFVCSGGWFHNLVKATRKALYLTSIDASLE